VVERAKLVKWGKQLENVIKRFLSLVYARVGALPDNAGTVVSIFAVCNRFQIWGRGVDKCVMF
jgi:hypothetical protein